MKTLTTEELYKITEAESPDSKKYKVADFLLQAVNDWRTSIVSLEDYFNQLTKMLKVQVLTKDVLENACKQLNPETHAWELESISNLIEAFKVSEINEMSVLIKYLN